MATLSAAKRIVVKIGSALLVENGELRADWLANKDRKKSSGVGAGRGCIA